jgi:mono/diheme cytochrome c family protein
MKNGFFSALALLVAGILALAFTMADQAKPWPVPDKYKNMKNTVKYDKAAASALWNKHCKSCHGKEGLGDGPKAAQLDTPSGDFSTAAFQKQSDGALFYKTLEGRDDMPGFSKKIPDQDDIWQLVHYMRGMKK